MMTSHAMQAKNFAIKFWLHLITLEFHFAQGSNSDPCQWDKVHRIKYSKTCLKWNRTGPNMFSTLAKFLHYRKLQKNLTSVKITLHRTYQSWLLCVGDTCRPMLLKWCNNSNNNNNNNNSTLLKFLPLSVASCCVFIYLILYDAINRNKVSIP
jgi:hypothetical protein